MESESRRAGAHQGARPQRRERAAELDDGADEPVAGVAWPRADRLGRDSGGRYRGPRPQCRRDVVARHGGRHRGRAGGHDVVMTPTSNTYFDYYQSQDAGHEPLAIGGVLPIDPLYASQP